MGVCTDAVLIVTRYVLRSFWVARGWWVWVCVEVVLAAMLHVASKW